MLQREPASVWMLSDVQGVGELDPSPTGTGPFVDLHPWLGLQVQAEHVTEYIDQFYIQCGTCWRHCGVEEGLQLILAVWS